MKAVFLDFATMGPDDLDSSPLTDLLPDLKFFDVTPEELTAERVKDAEFVFTNKIRFDDETLGGAKSLRFIGLTATGTDNVDLSGADKYGIAVCNIRAYCTQSVVEHVFAVLLNFTHNISQYAKIVRNGEWQESDEFCMLKYPIRELSGMTFGIVGHGVLGRGVEKIAREFGMTVLIARRPGISAKHDDGRTDFREMLGSADVITLHCPLSDDTINLFGEEEFRLMKPDAILINTARGGLIDSAALAAALGGGEIGAAAIDV
ncbi:MAG: glycerate dehydrogenase, partial [Woeseiaceae bacterium]|nr:glycerate dehydrogenase [Woeseiaceae bacterium]